MRHEFVSLYRGKKVIWVIAVICAVTLMLHYILLPYGSFLSSLFAADKVSFVQKEGSVMVYDEARNTDNAASSRGNQLNLNHETTSVDWNETLMIMGDNYNRPAEHDTIKKGNELNADNQNTNVASDGPPNVPNNNLGNESNSNYQATGVVSDASPNTPNDNSNKPLTVPDSNFREPLIVPDSNLNKPIATNVVNSTSHVNDSAAEIAQQRTVGPQQTYPTAAVTKSGNITNEIPSEGSVNSISPPSNSMDNVSSTTELNASFALPASVDDTSSSGEKAMSTDAEQKSGPFQADIPLPGINASNQSSLGEEQGSIVSPVIEMDNFLFRNRTTYPSTVPRWPSAADKQIQYAKSQIDNARNIDGDPSLDASLYWNLSKFKRSYDIMRKLLKIYIYKEGDKPIMNKPEAAMEGIYASEGRFMKQLMAHKKFVAGNPEKAHMFYLPFSSYMLEEKLYVPDSHTQANLIEYLNKYVDEIAAKHPFWNRTGGADHFLVACHDWAPQVTNYHMKKCIRSLCNADTVSEGFVLGKDASLPETYIHASPNPQEDPGGKLPLERSVFTFFAGGMHGYLRPRLLEYWGTRDADIKIFESIDPKDYVWYMKNSRYCICARGYEVNSPRLVEAIFYECVPVIIADNFVLPFMEVLNWDSFSVTAREKDIPRLKNILLSIPQERYIEMHNRLKKVQQHFLWHDEPEKYDIFHMILHSVWYNRLIQIDPK